MSYASTILADSPLVYLRLGEPSGTNANDETANNFDFTYTGGYSLGASALVFGGTSVDLNGSTGYVYRAVDAGLNLGNTFTFEAWLNSDALTAGDVLYFHGTGANALSLEVGTSGSLAVYIAGSPDYETATGALVNATTQHVVYTKDGATRAVYINGSAVSGSGTSRTAADPGSGNRYIGCYSGSAQFWDGRVQEFALYGTALTSGQVAAHYAAAFGPVWTTPADTVAMSTTPELKFNSPASAVKQHFYLQLDTANTFNTGNLRTYDSSVTQTNWDYWDGAAWTAMPSDGLPIAKSGNEIRYTVTSALSSSTWYRRVRAGTLV